MTRDLLSSDGWTSSMVEVISSWLSTNNCHDADCQQSNSVAVCHNDQCWVRYFSSSTPKKSVQLLSVMVFGATGATLELTIHRSTTANLMKLTHLLKNVRLVVMCCVLGCGLTGWNWMQTRHNVSGWQRGSDRQCLQHQSASRGIHYCTNQWRT